MHVPFEQLSDQSRVWIYASQTALTSEQEEIISIQLHRFTEEWQAHGAPLKASFAIKHGHFIIIGVDESLHSPSGCSIDKSVQIIKSIESGLDIDLMNRLIVYLLTDKSVQTLNAKELPGYIEKGLLQSDSQVFDNTITTLAKYKTEWIKPAQYTWLNRYFSLV
jgi:hypothetical protein